MRGVYEKDTVIDGGHKEDNHAVLSLLPRYMTDQEYLTLQQLNWQIQLPLYL